MSMIGVDYGVLNQRGSPSWFSDIYANIPTAGYKGRMFISTDTFAFYRDTGTGWDLIGGPGTGTITGSGATGQVSFFNGSSTLAGNNNLFWDNTNSRLGINTTTPGTNIDLHGTANVLLQLNNTTTANSNIAFQNQNVAKWRIGNEYGGGANIFSIYNVNTTSTPFQISNTTNQITINGAVDLGNNTLTTGTTFLNNGIKYKDNIVPSSLNSGYVSTWFNINGTKNSLGLASSVTSPVYYAYDFPNASGTIALTNDLSSYLPLSGGSLTGNLITNSYISIQNGLGTNQIYLTKSSGDVYGTIQTEAGGNKFSLGNVSNIGTLGTPNITWTSGMQVGINNSNPTYDFDVTGTGRFTGILRLGSTLSNGTYFYTLPSATGTLALTSNLSSYLPLTGGTLTGQLYINPTNTATTGLDVASNTTIIRSDNLEGFKRQLEIVMGSGTLVQLTAKGYGSNYGTDLAFYTATTGGTNASPGIYITGTNNRVGIKTGTPAYDLDVAGTGNFSGALTGSSTAAFVGNVTAGDSSGGQVFRTANAGTSSVGIRLTNTGGNSFIGLSNSGGAGYLSGSAYALNIQTEGARDLQIGTNNTLRMTILSGGSVGIGPSGTASSAVRLVTAGIDATSSNYSFIATNNVGGTILAARNDGAVFFVGPYPFTTAAGTNMWLDSSGVIQRNVSSIKYKKDVLDYDKGLNDLMKLRPVSYLSKSKLDNPKRYAGLIAEELFNLGFIEYVNFDEKGQPESISYATMVALLIKSIKELNIKLIKNNIN